jgi:glycosyltransferase involved in cell wall biosynthesis
MAHSPPLAWGILKRPQVVEPMRLTVISHSNVIDTNQQLFAELEELGITLQLIVPADWHGDLAGKSVKPKRLEGLRAALTPLPVVMSGSVPLHAYKAALGRQFYLFQPDAIYVENESYAVSTFQAAVANQLSVRRPLLFRNNQNLPKRVPPPFNLAERFVLKHAACANVVNEEAGTLLRSKGYKGRVAYMPYGVDVDFYHPQDARQLRESLGLKGMVFGFMGRLVSEKGVQDLVEAFARFHPEEEVSLLVIGNGPLTDELAARFKTPAFLGRARLLAAVEHRDVPRYLAAMSTLVLPSRSLPGWKEQFGRIIIEALACGVPVIGSNSGEIPHLLGRLGAGLVVPEGDVVALHGAMRRLLEVPGKHDELRELGRREVEQQYAHSALAYRFQQLLEAVVTDRNRGNGQEDALPGWAAAAGEERG